MNKQPDSNSSNTAQIGDIVRLRSGSPDMTVIGLIDQGDRISVTLTWFRGRELCYHFGLPLAALIRVPKPE